MTNPQQIARMQFVYGDDDAELDALLNESLSPRSPDFLFDLALPLLTPESRLLDVGCRDARHLIPLVARSGCTGVGIDPVERNLERATSCRQPLPISISGSRFNAVSWSRSRSLTAASMSSGAATCLKSSLTWRRASTEIARVLKPDGAAVIYTIFATPRLEPREAAASHAVGNVPQNLDRTRVEEAFADAGFRVERAEEIGTEFREYDEERTQPVSQSLLRLARLRRRREEVILSIRQGQVRRCGKAPSTGWPTFCSGSSNPSPTCSACPKRVRQRHRASADRSVIDLTR